MRPVRRSLRRRRSSVVVDGRYQRWTQLFTLVQAQSQRPRRTLAVIVIQSLGIQQRPVRSCSQRCVQIQLDIDACLRHLILKAIRNHTASCKPGFLAATGASNEHRGIPIRLIKRTLVHAHLCRSATRKRFPTNHGVYLRIGLAPGENEEPSYKRAQEDSMHSWRHARKTKPPYPIKATQTTIG